MKKVLIISFSNLKSDPRVYRQIKTLSRNFQIIAAGTGDPDLPGVEFIPLKWEPKSSVRKIIGAAQIKLGAAESFYWSQPGIQHAQDALKNINFDVVLANDLETLPLAAKLAHSRPILFDAHEYAPLEAENFWSFRTFIQPYRYLLCRRYLARAQTMTTVCQSIADKYFEEFGIKPEVITNAPHFQELAPAKHNTDVIRLVHHGVAAPPRKLELMIDMMKGLPSFELHFFLMGSENYIAHLKERAGSQQTVYFHQPVPTIDLPRALNEFDVGAYILPPITFNDRHALPNKFFEFIQARLAVAVGPSPEMSRLVRKYDLGVVATEFTPESMAQSLLTLDREKIQKFKENANRHARELSAIPNEEKLLGLVSKLVEMPV